MPSEGYEQKPAGVCCAHKMSPIDNSMKTMIAGKIANYKRLGGGAGATAKQKARMGK